MSVTIGRKTNWILERYFKTWRTCQRIVLIENDLAPSWACLSPYAPDRQLGSNPSAGLIWPNSTWYLYLSYAKISPWCTDHVYSSCIFVVNVLFPVYVWCCVVFVFVVYVWCCFVLLVVYVWWCFVFVCYVCLMLCVCFCFVCCVLFTRIK